MKTLAFLLLSFLSAVLCDRGPVDFYDCTGKQDGNYIHPSDCTKFMTCIASRYAYERDCSAGLNYDLKTDRCDWPENVGCVTDPGTTTEPPEITTTTTEGTTQSTQPTTITTEGTTNATQTPTTTTEGTTNSTQTPTTTTEGTTQTTQATTNTSSTDLPSTTPVEETSTDSTTEDPTTTDAWPTEEFTITTQNMTTTQSPTTEIVTSEPSTNATTTTVDPDACDHGCEYVGIDCHNYYTCVDFQRKEYHECSREAGLAFNPVLKVCDRIENVEGCGPETSEPPTTTEEVDCGCEYRPFETDCSKYYFCSDACKNSTCQVRSCPADLLWSVDYYEDGTNHQQCSLPRTTWCGKGTLQFSCYKKVDGLYENVNDCRSYWKCTGGMSLLYQCSEGFIFNPESGSCDFPGRALRFCSRKQ